MCEMRYAIVFVLLLSLLVKAQLDEVFPHECNIPDDYGAGYLEYTCKFEEKSRHFSSCVDESNSASVEVIRYLCETPLNSLTLHADMFNDFGNVHVLDTSNLGIEKITLVRSESIHAFENQIIKWTAVHNRLEQIPISILDWMPKITEINFSFNRIHLLNFKNLKDTNNITRVNCSHNEIGIIPAGAFATLTYLMVLDLSYNKINWILDGAFSVNINLSYESHLKELSLASNPLAILNFKVFSPLQHLEILDLSNTQIGYIDDGSFVNNAELKELNLKGTPLKQFNFNIFSPEAKLVDVQLPSKSIEELDISCVNEICHFENFGDDDFFENIRIFKATGNHDQNISKLLEKIGPKVETMDLSRNNIELLDVNILRRFIELRHLNLSHSRISKIAVNAFKQQSKLVTLDLSYNNLKDISSVSFSSQNKLERLNLVKNHLTKLNKFLSKSLPKLKWLQIAENPFENYSQHLMGIVAQGKNLKIDVLMGSKFAIDEIAPTHDAKVKEPRSKKTSITARTTTESTLSNQISKAADATAISNRFAETRNNESQNKESSDGTLYIVVCVLFALVIIMAVCLILCALTSYRHRKRFERAGLAQFEHGYVNGLNPELTLDVQADLLPYDYKYEFPRDKLKFGRELGAGAFGVVLEATAEGIVAHEKETKVAVKTVKDTANNEVIRALVSELKILIHLGRHLNLVNLLGAVTKDIADFNLMVIVEYCRFGNLHNFLMRNRRGFVSEIENNSLAVGSCSNSLEPLLQIQKTTPRTSAYVIMMDDATETPPHQISTKDLLIWSFQIARGMDYLASRHVLHGDLAARNVLLCDDNVVKICDFGLARSLYKSENYHYRMKSKRGLPYKWLALESLNDLVFSTSSDVWSFGIVLWELFSLGAEPYPCIEPFDLKVMLNDGYRMEKPEYATDLIYSIMLSCWSCNPEQRPTFNDLESSISKLIGKTEAEHHIDMNEPYLEANEKRISSGETDYIAAWGSRNAPRMSVSLLREKYFPFLSKLPDNKFSLAIVSDALKPRKVSLDTLALKTFKSNRLNRARPSLTIY